MRSRFLVWLVAGAAGAGCSFDRAGFSAADGGDVADAPPGGPDSATTDAPPPPPALAPGHGRLIYGVQGQTALQNAHRFDDARWQSEPATPALDGPVPWAVHRVGPTADAVELLLTTSASSAGQEVRAMRLTEGRWSVEWSAVHGDDQSAEARGFDLEFEASGDALAVYGIGTDTPAYRIFTAGEWSVERILPLNDGNPNPNPDTNMGLVRWVELERRPGTDEIALAYSDDRDDLVALVWNGEVWETDSAATLEDRLKLNPLSSIVHNRAFDVAFETIGGDVVVAWGRNNSSDFWYAVFDSAARSWSASTQRFGALSGTPHFVDLASDPDTDQVAGGFFDLGDGTERLALGLWNGFSWVDTAELDSQITNVDDSAQGDFPGAVAFMPATGNALCVYADDGDGEIDYFVWRSGVGWQPGTPLEVAGLGQPRSYGLAVTPDGATAIAVVSDDQSRLFGASFSGGVWAYDGATPVAMDIADGAFTPFSLDVR